MSNTTWNATQILDFLHQHRADLQALGVERIGLFGSYVRGEQHPDSDIDLLLGMDTLTFTRWMDVWNYLEDSLGVGVDLVPEQHLRDELKPYVLAEVVYVADI